MRLFKLHTNDGREYVRSTPDRLRAAMFAYIRDKRLQGMPLAAIRYAYVEVRAARTI